MCVRTMFRPPRSLFDLIGFQLMKRKNTFENIHIFLRNTNGQK